MDMNSSPPHCRVCSAALKIHHWRYCPNCREPITVILICPDPDCALQQSVGSSCAACGHEKDDEPEIFPGLSPGLWEYHFKNNLRFPKHVIAWNNLVLGEALFEPEAKLWAASKEIALAAYDVVKDNYRSGRWKSDTEKNARLIEALKDGGATGL